MVYSAVREFSELPLSARTLQALTAGGFKRMTDIQRAAIPHALAGRDVLGAARTGSGKTLAFLVPVLERLWRLGWRREDGLGALVISPTRELALQIFDVLRVVGQQHELSAGLVIGGKSVEEEQSRIGRMNVLVCTPGRLLQHLEQTYGFDCTNLQLLVLDEADRILDLGFSQSLNAIVASLPATRQTLLFSATQTKSVRDLARLSLSSPEYLAVHEQDSESTPDKLQQRWCEVRAEHKLDALFSFIKTHLRCKTLVFLSACKQVRFCYEMLRRVRPGVPLLQLHGGQSQQKRMAVYYDFSARKEAVMFCTDVAARGLDFPEVDWILQLDAPDSVQTYIHRVGRTARYRRGGQALLLLLPSELRLAETIAAAKVRLQRTRINASQLRSVSHTFQSFLAADPELKFLAQKALLAYLKSVLLQPDKAVFDLKAIDVPALAAAMGLQQAPRLSVRLGRAAADKDKNQPYALQALLQGKGKKRKAEDERGMSEMDRLLGRKNQGVLSEARLRMIGTGEEEQKEGAAADDDDDDDVLTVKRRPRPHDSEEEEEEGGGADDGRVKEEQEEEADGAEERLKPSTASAVEERLAVRENASDAAEGKGDGWLERAVRTLAAEDAVDKERERERSVAHCSRLLPPRCIPCSSPLSSALSPVSAASMPSICVAA